jgi:hypothetical protein
MGSPPSSTCPRARRTTQLHASCLARLKDARASLLASLRASRTGGELSDEAAVSAPDAVAAAVRQVISQELAAASAGACVAAGERREKDGVRTDSVCPLPLSVRVCGRRRHALGASAPAWLHVLCRISAGQRSPLARSSGWW